MALQVAPGGPGRYMGEREVKDEEDRIKEEKVHAFSTVCYPFEVGSAVAICWEDQGTAELGVRR